MNSSEYPQIEDIASFYLTFTVLEYYIILHSTIINRLSFIIILIFTLKFKTYFTNIKSVVSS